MRVVQWNSIYPQTSKMTWSALITGDSKLCQDQHSLTFIALPCNIRSSTPLYPPLGPFIIRNYCTSKSSFTILLQIFIILLYMILRSKDTSPGCFVHSFIIIRGGRRTLQHHPPCRRRRTRIGFDMKQIQLYSKQKIMSGIIFSQRSCVNFLISLNEKLADRGAKDS